MLEGLDEAVSRAGWGMRLDGIATVFFVQPDGPKDLLPAIGRLHEAGCYEALSRIECAKAELPAVGPVKGNLIFLHFGNTSGVEAEGRGLTSVPSLVHVLTQPEYQVPESVVNRQMIGLKKGSVG
jgi:hypothetical protein